MPITKTVVEYEPGMDEVVGALINPEYKYLYSLAEQLVKLKCVVSTKTMDRGGSATLVVISNKYPLYWCLNKLGWTATPGMPSYHKTYIREDGSWPLEVYWKGITFISIKPGYIGDDEWISENRK